MPCAGRARAAHSDVFVAEQWHGVLAWKHQQQLNSNWMLVALSNYASEATAYRACAGWRNLPQRDRELQRGKARARGKGIFRSPL